MCIRLLCFPMKNFAFGTSRVSPAFGSPTTEPRKVAGSGSIRPGVLRLRGRAKNEEGGRGGSSSSGEVHLASSSLLLSAKSASKGLRPRLSERRLMVESQGGGGGGGRLSLNVSSPISPSLSSSLSAVIVNGGGVGALVIPGSGSRAGQSQTSSPLLGTPDTSGS